MQKSGTPKARKKKSMGNGRDSNTKPSIDSESKRWRSTEIQPPLPYWSGRKGSQSEKKLNSQEREIVNIGKGLLKGKKEEVWAKNDQPVYALSWAHLGEKLPRKGIKGPEYDTPRGSRVEERRQSTVKSCAGRSRHPS